LLAATARGLLTNTLALISADGGGRRTGTADAFECLRASAVVFSSPSLLLLPSLSMPAALAATAAEESVAGLKNADWRARRAAAGALAAVARAATGGGGGGGKKNYYLPSAVAPAAALALSPGAAAARDAAAACSRHDRVAAVRSAAAGAVDAIDAFLVAVGGGSGGSGGSGREQQQQQRQRRRWPFAPLSQQQFADAAAEGFGPSASGPLLTPYALRALPAELAAAASGSGSGGGGKGLPAGAAAAFERALVASAKAAAVAAAAAAKDEDDSERGNKASSSSLLPSFSAEKEAELLASARMAWAGLKRVQGGASDGGNKMKF